MDSIKFGRKLKHLLEAKGISQAELVRKTGISKTQVSNYVNGFSCPNSLSLKALISALDIPKTYFEEPETKKSQPKEKDSSDSEFLSVEQAAKLMGKTPSYVRLGLQQRVFPWGYGVQTGENRWSYWIGKRRFFEETGIKERPA